MTDDVTDGVTLGAKEVFLQDGHECLLGVRRLIWDRTPNVEITVGLQLGTRLVYEAGKEAE